MTTSLVHALPGFLGLARDWDPFAREFSPHSFMAHEHFSEPDGLNAWAQRFNQKVETGSILIGYSLGGRLGVHALIQNPRLWKAAIVISAHPGLLSDEERLARLKSDQCWAQRFREEPWPNLMQAWNSQEIFSGVRFSFDRQECNYEREQLALILENFSLGKQADLRPQIAKLPMPILWVTGEYDQRFTHLATTLTLHHPRSQVWVASEAGHRIPWEQKKTFTQKVNEFLKGT